MPSTFTPNNGITLQATGENSGTWGSLVNTQSFSLIDTALDGAVAVTLTGSTHSLAITDGAASDGRNRVLLFTGTPGANCTVTVTPNDAEKWYFVYNGVTGGYSVTRARGGGAGTTVTVANGYWSMVRLDGTGSNANVTRLLDSWEVTTALKTASVIASTYTASASVAIKPGSNSTTGITAQNVAGTAILTVDTTNSRVGINATPNYTLEASRSTVGTNDIVDIAAITRQSSGTAAAGLGGRLSFVNQDAAGSLIESNKISSVWTDASAVNRYARMDFYAGINNTNPVAMCIDHLSRVGIGTTAPETSALLELNGTTGAFILSRMTTSQRDLLTPVNGMMIYNTTTAKIQGYQGGAWVDVA